MGFLKKIRYKKILLGTFFSVVLLMPFIFVLAYTSDSFPGFKGVGSCHGTNPESPSGYISISSSSGIIVAPDETFVITIQVKNFILDHPEIKCMLVMNEPNLTDQANRTPVQAAADWIKYEQVINDLTAQERTIYLVGPAMTWGTMTDYWDPVVWLDAFYSACKSANEGRDPNIDYLA